MNDGWRLSRRRIDLDFNDDRKSPVLSITAVGEADTSPEARVFIIMNSATSYILVTRFEAFMTLEMHIPKSSIDIV
jgi:hypothetical protein